MPCTYIMECIRTCTYITRYTQGLFGALAKAGKPSVAYLYVQGTTGGVGPTASIHAQHLYMRVHEKYACAGTDTQGMYTTTYIRMRKFVGAHNYGIHAHARTRESFSKTVNARYGLATSVGSVFAKPGQHTHPSCYFYCLHRARNGQNLVEGEPRSLAYWLVHLVFTP